MVKFVLIYLVAFLKALDFVATTANRNEFDPSMIYKDVQCLRELPISNLLRIKKSVEQLTCPSMFGNCPDYNQNDLIAESRADISQETISDNIRRALPLIGGLTRSHQPVDNWNEKSSKVQVVFQLSITALAFLAFGGYLLCMIVQAIKSKGTTYYHPAMMTSLNGDTNSLKKIKIYKRSRRSTNQLNANNAQPAPEDLYRVMVMTAEIYGKFFNL